MVIWIGFMGLVYLKADEITRHPCSICAEKMGDDILCTFKDTTNPVSQTYHRNGSITNTLKDFIRRKKEFSNLNVSTIEVKDA